MLKIMNYINGELVPPASRKYLKNVCPSTGENYSLIPDSDKNDVNQAVEAAQQAFKSWSRTPKRERSDILMKLADEIEKHSDSVNRYIHATTGKTLTKKKFFDSV